MVVMVRYIAQLSMGNATWVLCCEISVLLCPLVVVGFGVCRLERSAFLLVVLHNVTYTTYGEGKTRLLMCVLALKIYNGLYNWSALRSEATRSKSMRHR